MIGHTDELGGLKRPEVVKALADLQAHMLADPALGGTKGLPDLIRAVNRITHYNDPRWYAVARRSASGRRTDVSLYDVQPHSGRPA